MSGWWTALFRDCGEGERPGGLELTERAVNFCGFGPDSRLLDVAAGKGGTVRFLRRTLGCRAVGLDSDPSRICPDVALGRAEELPFSDGAFDGVLIECALSQMNRPDIVLGECARVLNGGGSVILSDLYARKGGEGQTPLGRLDSRERLEGRLRQAGLKPVLFEDHTAALTSLWAGAMLSGQGCGLPDLLHGPDWPGGLKPGYYLSISQTDAERSETPCVPYT